MDQLNAGSRKVAVVIGGSSGIGKAAAERFAREGYAVVAAAPESAGVKGIAAALVGSGHAGVAVDVRSEEQISRLADTVKKDFGRVDVLVNSAGISEGLAALESDFAAWDRQLQVMMYGTVKVCRALVPLVPDGGRIINVTSIHHERVGAGSSSYGMAKAGVTQFTRSLALELGRRGILVNAVAPGFVDTPMSVKANGVNELQSEWFKKNYVDGHHLPLRRAGRAEEIAGVIWFLAGPDASYITGSVVTVDGGLTITF